MKKFLSVNLSKSTNALIDQQPVNKWLENSFSLSDWTTEESTSIDEDSLKKDNKLVN